MHLEKLSHYLAGEGDEYTLIREGDIELTSGYLSRRELDAILRTLPFEITFIDANDRLRYTILNYQTCYS